ncbi:MAG: hypothetical protein OEZ21_05635 [Candidatus Bathyarchaeota archaeon]|nr:hypothetical protein [Candidatus Bathyarchaeota archaeon]MDH5746418.1 hypothetical protein [Candidatus Bathyarchaeota archaeon]
MSDIEYLRKSKHPPASLIERILSVMATLGLACLSIGIILHLYGRASDNLTLARIGAYMLVVGIMLMVPRLLFWISVQIVERA